MQQPEKTFIKVFITRSLEFRAIIKESHDMPHYEVTVGGKSWEEGKGRAYETDIIHKCHNLIAILNSKLLDLK